MAGKRGPYAKTDRRRAGLGAAALELIRQKGLYADFVSARQEAIG